MPILVLAAFLILAPWIPWLAHFAQSPDGAEMVSVALNGGVLHPSGMPLQAWVNYLLVTALPFMEPGYVLSAVSWFGGLGTAVMLLLLLRRLGVGMWVAVFAVTAYVYSPVVALMNITPEKYSWLTFTQMLFVCQLVRMIMDADTEWRPMLWLGAFMGLAFAQHSANIILLPPFLYFCGRAIFAEGRPALKKTAASLGVATAVTVGFYLSLLAMRSSLPWPDWGQLNSLADVWNHVVRRDYAYIQLYNQEAASGKFISAPMLLLLSLFSWHLAFLLVPIGAWFAFAQAHTRAVMGYLWMILLPGLAILAITKMPATDFAAVMGYQERYPILLLPLVTIFWAWGWQYILFRFPSRDRLLWGVLAAFLAVHVGRGLWLHGPTDNNIVDLYRQQAEFERDPYSLFWTSSDFTGFYGVPSGANIVFPVKTLFGMNWYRQNVLPLLAPPLARILSEPSAPDTIEKVFRKALGEGFKITVTEPSRFLQASDIMAMAEQTGVLWTFSPNNNSLYTKTIVDNTVNLCGLFAKAWYGLPREGLWFVREYLDSFKYAFQSAGDYYQVQLKLEPAVAARAVAEVLVPGRNPDEWIEKCKTYVEMVQ